ncbi:hypothetical protein SAMN05192589_1334 [Paracidovorax valerianellae]|uniref:DUF7716 domain-containing protein n=1 Tax=Paracidovorax valerianellae TaxID=187868 RepID=A0A1G7FKJ3_9BURK|nr:hypothetical protein [Paracidovorax valerianellae]SDE76396.1 hypothetical protein SAMN05192589_1334 [Paracidovorax valerianellae]
MKNLIELKHAIKSIEKQNGWLYTKESEKLKENSEVFFYTADLNLAPDEEKTIRKKYAEEGFFPYLTKEDIEDIIENLTEQAENPSINDYIKAIIFFHENDAFIEI